VFSKPALILEEHSLRHPSIAGKCTKRSMPFVSPLTRMTSSMQASTSRKIGITLIHLGDGLAAEKPYSENWRKYTAVF